MSRGLSTSSASARCSARVSGTRSSPSTATRERMRSSASSTEITPVFYRGGAGSAAPLLGQVQDGLVADQEPVPAQHEEGEEAERDQDLDGADRHRAVAQERGEDEQHPLEEDRDPAEEQDHLEDLVALGRPSGQALEQVGERDEP